MSRTSQCDRAERALNAPARQRRLGAFREQLAIVFQRNTARSGIALVFRQIAVMVLNIGSAVAVARWLGPEVVGRFAVLILVTQGILGYFGDLGIKAALIRKPGQLEREELASAFKLILIFSAAAAVCLGVLLPVSFRITRIGPGNYLPAILLLALLVLRNTRLIPLTVLERSMRFSTISVIEVTETLFYSSVLATLAYLHFGVWAYVLAMFCRDIFGSLSFNLIVRPEWRRFQFSAIRQHVRFSVFYQGAALLNMATTAFPVIVLARLVGKPEVGYVNWASALATYPTVLCIALARMYLPAFSTAARDPERLRSMVQKAIRINTSLVWPGCAVLVTLAHPIVSRVFTAKWLPAIPVLYSFCLATSLTAIGLPLSELFYARNDAKFNFRLSLLWMVLTWTVGLEMVRLNGLSGFVIFYMALQVTWLLAFTHAQDLRGVQLFAPAAEPLLFGLGIVLTNVALARAGFVTTTFQLFLVLAIEGLCTALLLLRTLIAVGGRKVHAASA